LQIKTLFSTIELVRESKVEETWDKKKIGVALIVLFILLGCIIYFSGIYKIKGESAVNPAAQIKKSVEGAQTSFNTEGIKEAVKQKIEDIKTEASSVDLVQIASSSPQVQKIINDLKNLENYPSDQAKSACEKICNQL
jgi:hypothetical protein